MDPKKDLTASWWASIISHTCLRHNNLSASYLASKVSQILTPKLTFRMFYLPTCLTQTLHNL